MPIFMFPEEELTKEELDDLIHQTELQRRIYEKLCDIQKTFDIYKQSMEEESKNEQIRISKSM